MTETFREVHDSVGNDEPGLVECPLCHSQFPIPQEGPPEGKPLRYHCSRCDNLFLASEAAIHRTEETLRAQADLNGSSGSSGDLGEHVSRPLPLREDPRPPTLSPFFSELSEDDTVEQEEPEQVPLSFPIVSRSEKYSDPYREEEFLAQNGALTSPDEDADEFTDTVEQPEDTAALPIVESNPLSFRPVFYLSTPLLVFALFLFFFQFALRSENALSETFSKAFFSEMPDVAPPGLYLKDVRYEKISLMDGETAHVISGKLMNNTARTFEEVLIEGVAFDGSVQPVANAKAYAGSEIASIEVKSLTANMLRDLQRTSRGRFELGPDDERKVTVALLGKGLSEARFYTARIYSVR